jgi:hypothetical protein
MYTPVHLNPTNIYIYTLTLPSVPPTTRTPTTTYTIQCYSLLLSPSHSSSIHFADGEIQWGEWMEVGELYVLLQQKRDDFVPDGMQVRDCTYFFYCTYFFTVCTVVLYVLLRQKRDDFVPGGMQVRDYRCIHYPIYYPTHIFTNLFTLSPSGPFSTHLHIHRCGTHCLQ